MVRIILQSGKGGVGKTTIAAATGLAASARGYRTLVISLDIAHSLSDSFDLDQGLFNQHGGVPIKINDKLHIQEIDVQEEIERHWSDVFQYIAILFSAGGLEGVMADEIAIVPGMEDIVALMYLNQYVKEGTYDVIVVDCPPTGESIRFVSISTSLKWYMRKRFKIDRALSKLARPFTTKIADLPIPDDNYFQSLQRLFDRLDGIEEVLTDRAVTSVRLVTNAEKMVVRETQRAYLYFSMFGITADLVVINRLLPAGDGYFARWAKTQANYSEEIREYFAPLPVALLPLFPNEIIGIKRLRELADALFKDEDPTQFYLSAPPFGFDKDGDGYKLEMKLPFATKEDVDVTRTEDEVVIRLGSFKRYVPLPRTVSKLQTGSARIEDGRLVIRFVKEQTG